MARTDREKAHQIIHDLRNALALVINYANLVANELADRPEVLKDLSEIRTASRSAAEWASDLATLISAGDQARQEPLP